MSFERTLLKEVQVSIDEVFTKKFINDYMLARENYTFDTAELNYYTAAAFMAPSLQRQWEYYWDSNNIENPFIAYKNATKIHIAINSIILHPKNQGKNDIATVHFKKILQQGELKKITYWIATLTYKYANPAMDEKWRRINPLGFQILDYRVDPEIENNST
ncbi:MAG: Type IV secretion system protein virB8 [Legionellaceae bacterium]